MNKTYLMITIENIINIVCWTILAIIFNKWWVALFSILFIKTVKQVRLHHRICDKCGKHGPLASTYDEAIEKAQEAGWLIRKVGDKWDDRCPDCIGD